MTIEVIYRIDPAGHLIQFNDQWDLFARDNATPQLVQGRITGQTLWNFIQDPETRHLHQTLVQRAKTRGHPLVLPFRCDAPALRRFMEMEIVPLADGGTEYRCRTLKTETRAAIELLAPKLEQRDPLRMLRMCSWCNKVAVADLWQEVEHAIIRLKLFDAATLPGITHTMCDVCLGDLLQEDD